MSVAEKSNTGIEISAAMVANIAWMCAFRLVLKYPSIGNLVASIDAKNSAKAAQMEAVQVALLVFSDASG